MKRYHTHKLSSMSRTDRIALILSLLAVIVSYLVAERFFERLAHLEDEMAYVWQAQALAAGRLTVPSPDHPDSFLVPFVVDYEGQRFGKYPLGWPLVLALGIRLGVRELINPLLAGLGVWLTYLLGRRIFGAGVGLLAAALTLTSPLFLVNSGSLLSHPLGLVLSAGFAITWLGAFCTPDTGTSPVPADSRRQSWLYVALAAACLGFLVNTRPLSAIGVALPFSLHGLYMLVRGDRTTRLKLVALTAGVALLGSLQLLWQYYATGDPFFNLYTLWWEYDRVGFGPGYGVLPEGHSLAQGWINARQSLQVGYRDLFGWNTYSWIFLPFGLLALIPNQRKWVEGALVSGVFPSLVLVYLSYWIGAQLFGPRYYYEGLYSLTILSAAGIAWLAGWSTQAGQPRSPMHGWQRLRSLAAIALLALLVTYNLVNYLPARLQEMRGLYGVAREHLQLFLTPEAQALTPALVIVHPQEEWIEYGTLLELTSPFQDTAFVVVISRGQQVDSALAQEFRQRKLFHYYPDEPYRFYTAPRPP